MPPEEKESKSVRTPARPFLPRLPAVFQLIWMTNGLSDWLPSWPTSCCLEVANKSLRNETDSYGAAIRIGTTTGSGSHQLPFG